MNYETVELDQSHNRNSLLNVSREQKKETGTNTLNLLKRIFQSSDSG